MNTKQLLSIDDQWPIHVFRDQNMDELQVIPFDKNTLMLSAANEKNCVQLSFTVEQAHKLLMCLQGMIKTDLTALDEPIE